MITPRSRLSFAVSFFFTTFFTTLAVALIAGADGVIDVESGSSSDCSVALCWGSGGGMAAALRAAWAASTSCSAEGDKRWLTMTGTWIDHLFAVAQAEMMPGWGPGGVDG